MKTKPALIILLRIIAFILLCLYSILVFGQEAKAQTEPEMPLEKFNGSVTEKKIKLMWTLAEGNTASAVSVEKGNGNGFFQPQAEYWVNMEGNFQASFQWSDSKITKGSSYYRLKITEANGNVTYSPVIKLTHSKKSSAISDYSPLDDLFETSNTAKL